MRNVTNFNYKSSCPIQQLTSIYFPNPSMQPARQCRQHTVKPFGLATGDCETRTICRQTRQGADLYIRHHFSCHALLCSGDVINSCVDVLYDVTFNDVSIDQNQQYQPHPCIWFITGHVLFALSLS